MLNCCEFSIALTRFLMTFETSSERTLRSALFEILAINFVLHQSGFSSGSWRQSWDKSDWNFMGPNRVEGCWKFIKIELQWRKWNIEKLFLYQKTMIISRIQLTALYITCDFAMLSTCEILMSKWDSLVFLLNFSWCSWLFNSNKPGKALSFFSSARWKLPSLMWRWNRYV